MSENAVRVSIGIDIGRVKFQATAPDGKAVVLWLTAEEADEFSATLRAFALELRNGGPLA